MNKIIVIAFVCLFSLQVNSQASMYYTEPVKTEAAKKVCEDNLVTTFTKYFSKPAEAVVVKKEVSTTSTIKNYASSFYNGTIDNVISVGKTFLGIPYRWGGTSEYGFDCSGFIQHIFNWFGISLPRTSREMASYGDYVPRTDLQKGDLIFFSGRNMHSGVIGHIGIVVEVTSDVIKMMHSSSSQGVHIEDLNQSSYFNKRYMTARRLPIDESKVNKN